MTKPEDIPQWAWEKAEATYDAIVGEDVPAWKVEHIASAILSAVQREKDQLSDIFDQEAENLKRLAGEYHASGKQEQADRCISYMTIHQSSAAAIRSRKEA